MEHRASVGELAMPTRRPAPGDKPRANRYRRKLSREDAETGTILITKNRWSMFPPPLDEFQVRVGRKTYVTTIVPEDCSCVPPAHQHMHLAAQHFAERLRFSPGDVIEIEALSSGFVVRNG
jgi:hypothetical protein